MLVIFKNKFYLFVHGYCFYTQNNCGLTSWRGDNSTYETLFHYYFREEIEEYYSKLTEEAAFREQKALWRVRRAKLDLDRINFLQQDTTHWSSQMEANPEPMVWLNS